MLFLQQNIYDKFDALRGESARDLVFWQTLTWVMTSVLVLAGCWFLYRRLLLARVARNDRRAVLSAGKRRNVERDELPASRAVDDLAPRGHAVEIEGFVLAGLDDIAAGTRIALYWNAGEQRTGVLGEALRHEASGLCVRLDEGEGTPGRGEATLLVPETTGHVMFHKVRIGPGPDRSSRRLQPAGPKSSSRIHHKYRAVTRLRGAAMRADGGAVLLRVQDLAFDGLGVLSEAGLEVGEELRMRLELPDYARPLELRGRVTWSQVDPVGVWRAGIAIDHGEPGQRLLMADFLQTTIRAESAELVLEKRRRENTPVAPQPLVERDVR